MSKLIKTFDTKDFRKVNKSACPLLIELYDDHVFVQYDTGVINFYFDKIKSIYHSPAGFSQTFSKIAFSTLENDNAPFQENWTEWDIKKIIHMTAGAFSYKKTIAFSNALFSDIKKVFDSFKENEKNNNISYNVSESLFYKKFKEKYNIDFDIFKEELHFITSYYRAYDKLAFKDNGYGSNSRYAYSVAYSEKFIIILQDAYCPEGRMNRISGFSSKIFTKLFTKKMVDNEYINLLEEYGKKFDTITNVIYSMDEIKYFEFVDHKNSYNINNNSRLGVAVNEAMFGTAAALSNAQRNINTQTYDNSAFRLVREFNSSIPDIYFDIWDVEHSKEVRDLINLKSVETYRQKSNVNFSSNSNISNADEIRKYKALLDDGIITEEEFEAKKKSLLGL